MKLVFATDYCSLNPPEQKKLKNDFFLFSMHPTSSRYLQYAEYYDIILNLIENRLLIFLSSILFAHSTL